MFSFVVVVEIRHGFDLVAVRHSFFTFGVFCVWRVVMRLSSRACTIQAVLFYLCREHDLYRDTAVSAVKIYSHRLTQYGHGN